MNIMRKELEKIDGKRLKFAGTFARFGTKTNYHGFSEPTVLLQDVRFADDKLACDHLWFNYTKGFQRLGELNEGDIIEFYARVKDYIKGYVNHREWIDERTVDYKLSYPTRFKIK